MTLAYSTLNSLFTYILHYTIARELYTKASHLVPGVSGVFVIGGALLLLLVLGHGSRRGVSHYERRFERPGRAYRRQRAIEEAKRDARESPHTRGRWRL